ncbi:Transcription elongation factor SPT5 [Actinoplanes sp. SE50]|uniref:hypothetical protein n=1 Tax=unclassified Actinoplanes TaxID=2626549 RepID=UPI00023EDE73|nr:MULTISPECIES: hypothetical protein [unclassified Actinoplanes]AEV88736.1 Transcription elongation factor SPT5 [Actinoplanes sp. SE50/110]ATO87140.1 Transcription elongation factor SPT5 [Actinoplanes sp. SE50]SLM04558.1 uncharacterized protein ACSP50_7865 [Actinoplanes sp. SE50/110]
MAEAPKIPAERPELRAAAPHQGGPLAGSGAASASAIPVPDKSVRADKGTDAEGAAETGDKPDKTAGPDAGAADKTAGTDARATDKTAGTDARATDKTASADARATDKTAGTDARATDKTAGTDARATDKTAGTDARATDKTASADAESKGTGADSGAGAGDKATDRTADAAAKAAGGDVATPEKAAEGKDAAAASGAAAAGRRGLVRRSLGLAGRGGRAVGAWARRPSGRVIIPSVIALLLIGLAGSAGVYLVPRALEADPAPSASAALGGAGAVPAPSASDPYGIPGGGFSAPPAGIPGFPGAPATGFGLPTTGTPGLGTGLGTGTGPGTGTGINNGVGTGARPADALAGWAQATADKVGIPVVAVQAYGYAELVTTQTTPTCRLNWTTLAAIGKVASGHGSANGAVLGVDGVAQPTIYGLPLDGQGGRPLVRDTDQGTIDQDPAFDREVGPMKMIPSAWRANAVDADRNGVADINDIDDAALAAASSLCRDAHGSIRNLARADAWWDAVLNYGALRPSAQKIFDAANQYGQKSRS